MGILSAIWNLIKKIFSAVLSWIGKIFGKLFWIILIVVLIWYAPVIVAWLTSIGAPGFVVSAFEMISIATPYVQSAGMWLWTGGSSLVSTAWQAFRGLDAGTQAAIALGAAAAIAPEETTALLEESVDLVVDGADAIVGALASNPVVWIAAGLGLWLLFGSSNKRREEPDVQPASNGG